MYRHRLLAFVVSASLVVALVPGRSSVALAGSPSRFERVPLSAGALTRTAPIVLDPTQRVRVVLQFAGDPVAVVKGARPDKRMSDGEKEAIKRDLKSRQDAEVPQMRAFGATVLGEYQVAINGVKVEVPRGKLADLAALPNVVAIRPVTTFTLENATSVPFIGAPSVWQDLGVHGEGMKIGIIDTGIDYTHANFGGPGTVTAWNAAFAASTLPADPALFGAGAPKVKGGTDLVGDAYDASAPPGSPALTPQPDPNPLDCNGHGSHVAGTAAGFGVTSAGATYTGPYDATTASQSFTIGPGVAPKADLYAIRVFGCSGSTDVVVDAIDWAVDQGMDVINMSLGSDFGSPDSAEALAATNAVRSGVVVVASAGNSGQVPYITGSPASGDGAISVAAVDSTASFPGATLSLSTGKTVTALNANAATFADGTSWPVVVLRNANGTTALGCTAADYDPAVVAGKIVVTKRGVCARVARAVYGQKAGAAAVVMINSADTLPPFEGPITANPDTGEQYVVTIPFFGAKLSDETALRAVDGGSITATNANLANPGFRAVAGFSSSGPRNGDSAFKPEVAAPGVSIQSTAVGTGNQGTRFSGTSMAAPHVAGVAALVRQAHPRWDPEDIKAAIVNTADPSQVAGYAPLRAGAGLVQPFGATRTQVTATAGGEPLTSLSFGFAELDRDYRQTQDLEIRNRGGSPATFTLAATSPSGRPHAVSFSRTTVTVPANGKTKVAVTLSVPVATAGSLFGEASTFYQVSGLVTLTPATSSTNEGVALRVPYSLVPRARSSVKTTAKAVTSGAPSQTATVRNRGPIAGDADFYTWLLQSRRDGRLGSSDLRAVGAKSFPDPSGRVMVFAINTWTRWSSASTKVFDVLVDTSGDGQPDFDVEVADLGLFTTGSFAGWMATAVFDLNRGGGVLEFVAPAPTDATTILLPVLAEDLGLSPANPRLTITGTIGFDLFSGATDDLRSTAKFNAYASSVSQGAFLTVPAGGTATTTLSLDPVEFARTPALGWMVVSFDNPNGAKQAQLIGIRDSDDDGGDRGGGADAGSG